MKEEEFVKSIGNNIVLLRNEKGIKQIDLANAVGIEDSALRRIEKGRTNPTAKTLFRIATALNVEVANLVRPFTLIENKEEEERVLISNNELLQRNRDLIEKRKSSKTRK